jgi:hypothetical protein
MSESCRDWRGDLAALALGNLDEDARVALQAHLDGCAACRAELAELTAVARALPAADTATVTGQTAGGAPEPPAGLADVVLGRLAYERARERRHGRRHLAVILGTAAAAVAAGIGLLVLGASLDADSADVDRRVVFAQRPEGVSATAELRAEDYGTHVTLEVDGLSDGRWYWLWLTGDDGERVGAGTFRARGDHYTVEMTTAIALDDTRRIWVTDDVSDDADAIVLDALVDEPA